MNENTEEEGYGEERPQPAWLAEQISLFTAAIGMVVRFVPFGEARLLDSLAGFCSVFRSEDRQRQAACQIWHACQAATIKQSTRAIRLRCPMRLDYLWAPVSKAGELYGFLYTGPVMQDGGADGEGREKEQAWPLGNGSQEIPELNRRRMASLQRVLRVKSAQSDGLLLLMELMGQRLGARFHQEKRLPVPLNPAEALVRRAEAVLCSCYHEKVSTRDIASELRVSESHLCHAFHEVTGGTLREHLNELRFTEACRLLREHPQLTVAEVAFAAGFQSLSRFGEQFRRRHLPSPGKWRHADSPADLPE